ncbi:MAG: HD domain-containing protein [Bacillota bacterium]
MDKNKIMIKALEYSAVNHRGNVRKGSNIPYIVHPVEVAMILRENSLTEEVIAAGLLHDVLEDTYISNEEIQKEFGKDILRLVVGASERLDNRDERSWKERKKHTIDFLKNDANFKIRAIACADKLSNIRSMIRDLEHEDTEKFWDRFNAGAEEQKWYYESLVDSLQELEGIKMYEKFKAAVNQLFN